MIDHKIHAILKPTRDYSSFSFNEFNRDVVPSHVDRLEEAIAEQNLLDLYPLVTTAERVIVDGQNRFSMARNLMIPFYYTASEHLAVGDIMTSNELTLSYNERDAMHSYTSMGVEPYVIMGGFMDRFKKATDSNTNIAVSFLCKRYSKSAFIRGELAIDHLCWGERIAEYVTQFREYSKVFDAPYCTALKRMMLTGKYDHKRMMGRVEKCSRKLVRCKEWMHAVGVLQEIYNYGIPMQSRVDFLSLVNERQAVPAEDRVYVNDASAPQRQIEGRKESTIYMTTHYALFSPHPSLRPLREVDRLRDYIQHRNLLQHYPIIVNEKLQIMDGQRRFMAAKQLGLPVYFIISSNFSVWMATIAGGTRKDWSLNDYSKSYAKQGLPEYVWLEEIRARYSGMTPSVMMRVHTGGYVDKVRKFRLGQAKFDHPYIEDFCRQWLSVESSQRWTYQPLIRAALGICDYGQSMDRLPRLVQVINRNWSLLEGPMSAAYAAEVLLDLYNKRLRTTEPARSRSLAPGVGIYRPQPAA